MLLTPHLTADVQVTSLGQRDHKTLAAPNDGATGRLAVL